jgi:hypothetical protein
MLVGGMLVGGYSVQFGLVWFGLAGYNHRFWFWLVKNQTGIDPDL